MKFFLKQNLPGIKAGSEMRKGSRLKDLWFAVDSGVEAIIHQSELSDWIEERDGMWKPKMGDEYFSPALDEQETKHERYLWDDSQWGNARLANGLVCPTPELAIELADRMIETAKKFWEEKKRTTTQMSGWVKTKFT